MVRQNENAVRNNSYGGDMLEVDYVLAPNTGFTGKNPSLAGV